MKALTVAIALAVLALPAPAASAINWTEVPSGTTAEITAVEYQGPDRFWFTTANGAIFKRQPAGTFTQVRAPGDVRLNDIEFQDGGAVGMAVGNSGLVLRSSNAGDTWTPITGIPVSKKQASATFPSCNATEPLGTVNAVRFAGATRVWLFAEGSQLARSSDAGLSFVDANRITTGPDLNTCKIDQPGSYYNAGHADGFFSPANPDVGYIVHGSSRVFAFTDNLATRANVTPQGAGNAGDVARVLAGDPDNTTRMWSVAQAPYGTSTMKWTEDAWLHENPWTIVNDSFRAFPADALADVDFRGGTVLAAGNNGAIMSSVNGRDFFYVDDMALPAQDWHAVGVADATNAAVGGTGGKLIVTTNANATPDTTPPTGTIAGPDSGVAGAPLTFTATLADEVGGSGINGAASSWTTPGLPNQAGPSATFTFPQPGSYTITLAFADNAGNTATAAKGVTITPTSGTLPGGTLPAPSGLGGTTTKPPLAGGAAKKKGKYVIFRVRGKLGLPKGVSAAQGCNGTMSISVYKGKKRLAAKRTSVSSTCRYKKTVKVKRKKVGKARKLKLKVAFKGNSFLAPLSSTYKAKVK